MNQAIQLVQDRISTYRQAVVELLPAGMRPDRMIRLLRVAVTKTPALASCTPVSLLECVVQCSLLGLEPQTVLGHCWLIPFKTTATIIVGYKGYMKLATEEGGSVTAEVVYENDLFECHLGTRNEIIHRPAIASRGRMIGAYAIGRVSGADSVNVWCDAEYIQRVKARSPGAKKSDSPWNDKDWEPSMWRKTAIRRLAPHLPLPKCQAAAAYDERPASPTLLQERVPELAAEAFEAADHDDRPEVPMPKAIKAEATGKKQKAPETKHEELDAEEEPEYELPGGAVVPVVDTRMSADELIKHAKKKTGG